MLAFHRVELKANELNCDLNAVGVKNEGIQEPCVPWTPWTGVMNACGEKCSFDQEVLTMHMKHVPVLLREEES